MSPELEADKTIAQLRARIAELEYAMRTLLEMEDCARKVGIAVGQKGSPNWKKWELARAVLKHGEKA